MNIVVCIKQVPDTESVIKIKEDGSGILKEELKYIMNPYDEFAVEEALRIKEKFGEGTVTLITVGLAKAAETLRTGLAMGADRAVHLDDPAFEGADGFAAAKALAWALKGMEYDLILCGKQAMDDDLAQVGVALAEFLNIPHASVITKLEISPDKKKAKVNRQIEGGEEVMECSLPALFTCQKGLNEPRYPSLPGILKAKKKELKVLNREAPGLKNEEVGALGAKTKILNYSPPPQRKAGRIIEGEEALEIVKKLVQLLRGEAKVI